MKIPVLLIAIGFLSQGASSQKPGRPVKPPIIVNTRYLQVSVDVNTCRWSVKVKGTDMQMNDIHFLPANDPSGWRVAGSVNNMDSNHLGSFVTVTLWGTKPGQLDFDYKISVSKTGNDIMVSLGRTNQTGKAADIDDMDYFVSSDARLGGTLDKWVSLGTHSRNRDYYYLWSVINLITPKMYAVNQVIRDSATGNSLLMGHVTVLKGRSAFEVSSDWTGPGPDRMKVRAYCNYKVTMPAGKSFAGEQLLIDFNTDALRAMEHQADLIAIAYDIRLKERRPIDLNDEELVADNYSRYHGWMSGGTSAKATKFFKDNGLFDFYWGLGGPGPQGTFGVYGSGGSTQGRPSRTRYPAECYLPVHTVKYDGERVIDFSNPLSIKLERERAIQWVAGHEKETGRAEMDFADWWDKWPGQYDPYMSAAETYRAGGMPWREVIDRKAPRRIVRSNMNAVDLSYGIVDVCRISEDADQGYEDAASPLAGKEFSGLFTETVLGLANRFFYNGRVFWNDGDGFHIYKYKAPDGKFFNAGQAKVDANFHAMAGNTLFLSEALDTLYPADRVELLKRIAPPTPDVSYPVDLFVRRPAQVWNMPVERPFGKWNILAVFNYTSRGGPKTFSTRLDAEKDLRLDPEKEYIVYEFWSRKLIGTFKRTFVTRAISPYDCDIYSIVENKDRPTLISTSRHIRQMAVDIKDLAYDTGQRFLKGISRMVAGDPYQLRIYVPDNFAVKRVEFTDGLDAMIRTEGNLLTIDFNSSTGKDVGWKVFF
jgi:hypothetical protein